MRNLKKRELLLLTVYWLIGCEQGGVAPPCAEEEIAEQVQGRSIESASSAVEIEDKELPEAWVRSTRVLGREGVILPQVPNEKFILEFEMAIPDIAKRSNPNQENRWVDSFFRHYQMVEPGVMEVVLVCKMPDGFGVKDLRRSLQVIYGCYCTARFDLKTKKGTVHGCWEPEVSNARDD